MNNRLWICCGNDIETDAITKLLKSNGEDSLLVSKISGTSWEDLNSGIKGIVRTNSKQFKDIIGIGLVGELFGANTTNIDILENDEGYVLSRIQQVADILGKRLTPDQHFISEYSKYGEQGVYQLADAFGIDEGEEILESIKNRERRLDGVTIMQEAEAVKAIENAKKYENLIELKLPHNMISTVLDRVSGNNILMICPNDETYFLGEEKYIDGLSQMFDAKKFKGMANLAKIRGNQEKVIGIVENTFKVNEQINGRE